MGTGSSGCNPNPAVGLEQVTCTTPGCFTCEVRHICTTQVGRLMLGVALASLRCSQQSNKVSCAGRAWGLRFSPTRRSGRESLWYSYTTTMNLETKSFSGPQIHRPVFQIMDFLMKWDLNKSILSKQWAIKLDFPQHLPAIGRMLLIRSLYLNNWHFHSCFFERKLYSSFTQKDKYRKPHLI